MKTILLLIWVVVLVFGLSGCALYQSQTSEPETYGTAQPLVERARSVLADKLDIESRQIEVEGVDRTEFSDASLGVPEPGRMYAQVITPGYIITLTVNNELYQYHASEQRVVLAD